MDELQLVCYPLRSIIFFSLLNILSKSPSHYQNYQSPLMESKLLIWVDASEILILLQRKWF